VVRINDQTCVGCSTCATVAPTTRSGGRDSRHGGRDLSRRGHKSAHFEGHQCDLCSDQLTGPACQATPVPHDALVRIDMSDSVGLAKLAWAASGEAATIGRRESSRALILFGRHASHIHGWFARHEILRRAANSKRQHHAAALRRCGFWMRAEHRALQPSAYTTGYLLLPPPANWLSRAIQPSQKLPYLPIGSSARGSNGIFTSAWARSASLRSTSGPIGRVARSTSRSQSLLIDDGSGFVGLFLSRTIPAQLARVDEK